MKTKFEVGDVLVRSAYKDSKSKLVREECEVIDIINDGHPICPQVWYITIDSRNTPRKGLQSVMEDCFEKVC